MRCIPEKTIERLSLQPVSSVAEDSERTGQLKRMGMVVSIETLIFSSLAINLQN